jgi:methylated-DNA-[protein]-cysteine S-methyltransferase
MKWPQISCVRYQSPLGTLKLGVYEDTICLCDWEYRQRRTDLDVKLEKNLQGKLTEKQHPLHNQLIEQLAEYFDGNLEKFELPLTMVGTDFQKRVWKALIDIPYGETRSYSTLAESMGCVQSVRAIATAIGANTLAIVVPCHRVIGRNGALTGYAGGLSAKEYLLRLENAPPFNQVVLF